MGIILIIVFSVSLLPHGCLITLQHHNTYGNHYVSLEFNFVIKYNLIGTGDSARTELSLPNVFLLLNGCHSSGNVSTSQISGTWRKVIGIESLKMAPSGPHFPESLPFLTMEFPLHNAADGIYDASTCFVSRLLLAGLLGRNLLPSVCFHFSFLFLWVLGIEPRTWWMLGKSSITGLHPCLLLL